MEICFCIKELRARNRARYHGPKVKKKGENIAGYFFFINADHVLKQNILILVPFLAVRDDYHPKRNQARQKLATLPQNRFKDLASDVYVQLERQFPTLLDMFPVCPQILLLVYAIGLI